MPTGLVIRVTDTSNPQTFCDLDEHRLVVDIDNLLGRHLGYVRPSRKMSASVLRRWTKQEETKRIYELLA